MRKTLECVVLPTGNNPKDVWCSRQHVVVPEFWTSEPYVSLPLDERVRFVIHSPYSDVESCLSSFKEAQQHNYSSEISFSNTRRRDLAFLLPFALSIPMCIMNGVPAVNECISSMARFYDSRILRIACEIGFRALPFISLFAPLYIFGNVKEWPTRKRIQAVHDFFECLTLDNVSTVHNGLLEACAEVSKRVEPRDQGRWYVPEADMRKLELHQSDAPLIVLHAMHNQRYRVSRPLGHLYKSYGKERPPDPSEYEKHIKKPKNE